MHGERTKTPHLLISLPIPDCSRFVSQNTYPFLPLPYIYPTPPEPWLLYPSDYTGQKINHVSFHRYEAFTWHEKHMRVFITSYHEPKTEEVFSWCVNARVIELYCRLRNEREMKSYRSWLPWSVANGEWLTSVASSAPQCAGGSGGEVHRRGWVYLMG